jgi:hypothetical protein
MNTNRMVPSLVFSLLRRRKAVRKPMNCSSDISPASETAPSIATLDGGAVRTRSARCPSSAERKPGQFDVIELKFDQPLQFGRQPMRSERSKQANATADKCQQTTPLAPRAFHFGACRRAPPGTLRCLAQATSFGTSVKKRVTGKPRTIRLQSDSNAHDRPWRVAVEQGFFRDEGLDVEYHEDNPNGIAGRVEDFSGRWKESQLQKGALEVYPVCEWGAIERVQQLGKGKIIGLDTTARTGAIMVRSDCKVKTLADLRNVPIAVTWHAGPFYAAIEAMEAVGVPFDEIKLVHANDRLDALLSGRTEAGRPDGAADMKEIKRNFARLDEDDQMLFRLLATTGMRLSEAFEIDGEEKERRCRYVIVGHKTEQSKRRVPLPTAVLPFLPKAIKGPLFARSRHVDPADAASKRLNRFLNDCGIVTTGVSPFLPQVRPE